jgi:hypothetical protein
MLAPSSPRVPRPRNGLPGPRFSPRPKPWRCRSCGVSTSSSHGRISARCRPALPRSSWTLRSTARRSRSTYWSNRPGQRRCSSAPSASGRRNPPHSPPSTTSGWPLRVAHLSPPLRRLFVWLGRNIGGQAAIQLGTFGISGIYGEGFFIPNPATHWTSFLIYTPIGASGTTQLNTVFDHRVMDGSHAIAGFRALQAALLGPVLAELLALAPH